MVEFLSHEAARASNVFQTIHCCSFVIVVRSRAFKCGALVVELLRYRVLAKNLFSILSV